MKRLFTVAAILISNIAYSQCVGTVNIVQQACSTNCSGLVFFTANGGQMPYVLTIDSIGPITLTSQVSWGNLCPGTHYYTIIDVNGDTCSNNVAFTITASSPPDATVATVNASCPTCPDGAASITGVTGGSPPYTYSWSNGSNSQSITGLLPGAYYLTVVDANGCMDVDTVMIGVGNSTYFLLGGNVYMDVNQNGVKDSGEPGVGNQQVDLLNPAITAYSNNTGDYAFVLPNGTYDVSYVPSVAWNLSSSPSTYNVTISGNSVSNLDFGVSPDSSYASGYCTLWSGWPRCNMNVPYYISIYNNGFTVLDGTAQFNFSPLQSFVSSTIPPSTQTSTQLNYNFSGLAPGSSLLITVTLLEPGAGNTVNSNLSFVATDVFANTVADTASLNQVVACSFDPNDKAVSPEGYGGWHYVTMDSELDYLIRFQNTGNDTAYNVVVLDTLDAGLDFGTFTVTGYSHPMQTTLSAGGALEFRFDDIYLPDSNVNEPASHGYIMYRIKGLSGNPDPTVINNTAYIYFDQNAPVVTNTTLTTFSDVFLGIQDQENAGDFSVYPNPFSQTAQVRYSGEYKGLFRISIVDIAGREVVRSTMNHEVYELSARDLSPGSYLIILTPDDGAAPSMLRIVIR